MHHKTLPIRTKGVGGLCIERPPPGCELLAGKRGSTLPPLFVFHVSEPQYFDPKHTLLLLMNDLLAHPEEGKAFTLLHVLPGHERRPLGLCKEAEQKTS